MAENFVALCPTVLWKIELVKDGTEDISKQCVFLLLIVNLGKKKINRRKNCLKTVGKTWWLGNPPSRCMYSQSCLTVWLPQLLPTRLLCPQDCPGKNTGVGCHFLLQEIFLTQGLNPPVLHLLQCQVDALPLYRLGSPSLNLYTVQKFKVFRTTEAYLKRLRLYPLKSSQHKLKTDLGLSRKDMLKSILSDGVSESEICSVVPDSLQPPFGSLQARILEWVGSHSLLQGIFPTQGLNPGLLHRSQIFYQLSHQRIAGQYFPGKEGRLNG